VGTKDLSEKENLSKKKKIKKKKKLNKKKKKKKEKKKTKKKKKKKKKKKTDTTTRPRPGHLVGPSGSESEWRSERVWGGGRGPRAFKVGAWPQERKRKKIGGTKRNTGDPGRGRTYQQPGRLCPSS